MTDHARFDPMDPEEIVPVSFDFEEIASSIVSNGNSPLIVLSRHSGAEDTRNLAATMISGSPQIVGLKVLQKITAPQAGTIYKVRCRVDTPEGYRWAEAALLPGETK